MSRLQTRRRELLKFLAASPFLTGPARLLAEETLAKSELPNYLIGKPEDALDVFDFHTVAKHRLPPAHYGYLTTGTDGNETLSANRRAFEDVYLRGADPPTVGYLARIELEWQLYENARARLTRLLTVPTATPQTDAASS